MNRDYESCLCFEKKKKPVPHGCIFSARIPREATPPIAKRGRGLKKKKWKWRRKKKKNEWKEEEEETNRYLGLFFFWMGGGLCRFVGRNSTCRPGKSSTWNIRLYLLGPYILASGRTAWLYQSVSSYGPVETRSLLLLSLSPIFASFFSSSLTLCNLFFHFRLLPDSRPNFHLSLEAERENRNNPGRGWIASQYKSDRASGYFVGPAPLIVLYLLREPWCCRKRPGWTLVTPKNKKEKRKKEETRAWPPEELASLRTHELASVSKNPGWVNSVQ